VPLAVPASRTDAAIADASLTKSEGTVMETATKARAEAAAEAPEMVDSAKTAEMVESTTQQQPERPRLSARPCRQADCTGRHKGKPEFLHTTFL
jgi:hypothetical protein